MTVRWSLLLLLAAAARPEDSRVCAGCHQGIWESYQQTGMGRAFAVASPANTGNGTYYHAPSESWFANLTRDGKHFQRRWQVDRTGREVNVMEKQIHFVMGSGNHARTFLHRTPAGALFELPLGWYSENGGLWAMNPGYDRPDHDGFRRPITNDCMFCHNAYPNVPARAATDYVYPSALPQGIDCARCHGPGARHTQLAGAQASRQQIRQAIVNPSRLPAERQLEVCMACHLETTSFPLPNAIQRLGRGPFSFRPGEPLGDFILNFDHAPGTGRGEKFEIVNAAYRMRQSACFTKSQGQLLCTTCHDPHAAPRGAEAVRRYDTACVGCHAAASAHTAGKQDCAGCHMPKRRTEDVIHVLATDHRIQRLLPPGDRRAERTEIRDDYRGPVVLYYPENLPATPENELYLAAAQVKQKSNLAAGIAQLLSAIQRFAPRRPEWYLDLAEAMENDGRLANALPWYREAARRDPASPAVTQRLGTALRRSAAYAESAQVLQRAATLAPERALTWHELGLTYRSLGRNANAIAALRRALASDPEIPEAHNNLGILTLSEASFREAIRIKPDYADAHANLASLLSGAGRFAEAEESFTRALRLRPADARTRFNYAVLLGRTNRYDQAQRELEVCVRADPGFAEAHELLGDLLLARGEARLAAERYRAAVRLQPDSPRANLGLGLALAAVGDRAGAQVYLRKAAQSDDAGVRARATEALRR